MTHDGDPLPPDRSTHDGPQLPADVRLVRTTPWFDQRTRPDGLLRTHRIAAGVWGRLVVAEGSLVLVFEDDGTRRHLTTGDAAVIPPERPHHVELDGPLRFAVEFHSPG